MSPEQRARALRMIENLAHAVRDPVTGEHLDAGVYANAVVEDVDEALSFLRELVGAQNQPVGYFIEVFPGRIEQAAEEFKDHDDVFPLYHLMSAINMSTRPDYCPIGGMPCQSRCDTQCVPGRPRDIFGRERSAPARREDMQSFAEYLRQHPDEARDFFKSAGVDEIVKAARGAK